MDRTVRLLAAVLCLATVSCAETFNCGDRQANSNSYFILKI